MPELRVKVDKKYVQRHAEGYLNDQLVASRGDHLQELAADNQLFGMTHQQLGTLERLVQQDGVSLVIAEDGTIRVD